MISFIYLFAQHDCLSFRSNHSILCICGWMCMSAQTDSTGVHVLTGVQEGRLGQRCLTTAYFSKSVSLIYILHGEKRTVAMLLWYQVNEMSETTSSEAIPQFCKCFSRWFDSFFWCGPRWRWTLGFLTPPWHSAILQMSRGEVWILSRIDTYLNWMRIEEVRTEILHHHNRNTNTPLNLLLFTCQAVCKLHTAVREGKTKLLEIITA